MKDISMSKKAVPGRYRTDGDNGFHRIQYWQHYLTLIHDFKAAYQFG